MTYLNNLLHYLINISYTYPIVTSLLLLLLIQIFICYKLLVNKKLIRDLKIYNFTLNALFISCYFGFFILMLLVLRYIRWGFTLNLSLLSTNMSNFYDQVPLIISLNFLMLILIIFLYVKNKSFFT